MPDGLTTFARASRARCQSKRNLCLYQCYHSKDDHRIHHHNHTIITITIITFRIAD